MVKYTVLFNDSLGKEKLCEEERVLVKGLILVEHCRWSWLKGVAMNPDRLGAVCKV